MADVTMTMEEYMLLINSINAEYNQAVIREMQGGAKSSFPTNLPTRPGSPARKRKVSKYNREFGRQLKALKKKHPRSKTSALMKRAHALTKKALK